MDCEKLNTWCSYCSFAAAVGPMETDRPFFVREKPDGRNVVDSWMYGLTRAFDNDLDREAACRYLLKLSRNEEIEFNEYEGMLALIEKAGDLQEKEGE